VRGAKERDHDAIRDLLVRPLKDETKHYSYAMDIKEVLVFGDMAVVRLVWTLTIKQADGNRRTAKRSHPSSPAWTFSRSR